MDRMASERRPGLSPKTFAQWALAWLLSVSGLVAALTGIYFLFTPTGGFQGGRNPAYDVGFLFTRGTWVDIHTWSGVALLALGVLHIAVHWKWLLQMLRRSLAVLFGRRKSFNRKIWVRVAIVSAVALPFIAVLASSLYFLFVPGGSHAGGGAGASAFIFSRSTWDLVHTWASVTFIIAVTVHFTMRWKWLARVTPAALRVPAVLRAPAAVGS